jgi:hypothetical protein
MNFISLPVAETTTRKTFFLPAERASQEEVLRQHELLASDPIVRGLLDSSLSLTMILNEQRQAVLINEACRARLGLRDAAEAVGSRWGEYLGCRREAAAPSGCGTSQACRACGAARAMFSALKGMPAVNPCRIQAVVCGQDLNLMVRVSPFAYKSEQYLLVSGTDIASEIRRRELEQIFFHDVINTASGVQGLLHFMQDSARDSIADCLPIARRASDTLIDELLGQRDLASAENGELAVSREEVPAGPFLSQIAELFAKHPLAIGKTVALSSDGESLTLRTDKTLLSRVIVNLTKNALEAVPAGAAVTVSCRREGDAAVFSVHNPGFMPPEVQDQVFQRSFSTKGAGRGLGTYSIRLLTENYLGGTASFTSDPARGTTFQVAYPLEPVANA